MPSLSTSQLVVLWYGGMIISFIVWNASGGGIDLIGGDIIRSADNDIYKAFSVALLTVLLIYTLGEHPKARKGWVAFWVLTPILAILGIVIYAKQVGPNPLF